MKIAFAKLDGKELPLSVSPHTNWVVCLSNDVNNLLAFNDDWSHGPMVKFLNK